MTLHKSISLSRATESEPARLHYWLTDSNGGHIEIASEIVDFELFKDRNQALIFARRVLMTQAKALLSDLKWQVGTEVVQIEEDTE